MKTRALSSACVCACLFLGALSAEANIQSDRWFHEVTQVGQDVHLTLQFIEEDPPAFDATFKLTGPSGTIFENKQFVPEEADEVEGPGCLPVDVEAGIGEPIDDCDGDGTNDCAGICGTAYRYNFVDECVPPQAAMYSLQDSTMFNDAGVQIVEEGPFHIINVDDSNDSCLDSGACSVVAVSGGTTEAALAGLMLLIGVGFAAASRRRANR
jgi:hypothetical protein